jgi:4-aminobutyrate aminotransferase / (S)-3-amino-2-methylpropionate transaminase / 5-aminovalerate transaminase
MSQQDLLARRTTAIPRGISNLHPLVAARAAGARLWDSEGREYIDFMAAIGVLNVGHNHPRVVQAVQEQLALLGHSCFQVAMHQPYIELAERLNALAPLGGPAKTAFFTSGAEAVENAVKIARAATGRPAVIAFQHSFHGRTLLGMSLTGKAAPYRQRFGPFAPEIYHVPFPYEYRGWSSEQAIAALEDLFVTNIVAEQVAAVIIEPVLGEGGFVVAPPAFLRELRRITRQHGILLIADEIQSGFGRTGRLFAIEHSGVEPDLITVAKSLAGGLPLSGVVGRAEVMDGPLPGGLGGTYAGNPLACAAALAVLEVIADEQLFARADAIGARLKHSLNGLHNTYQQIGDVRGLGAMVAMEFVSDRDTRTPAPEIAQRIVAEARAGGLLLMTAGAHRNVIRLLPPLVTDDATLEQAISILERAVRDVIGGKRS